MGLYHYDHHIIYIYIYIGLRYPYWPRDPLRCERDSVSHRGYGRSWAVSQRRGRDGDAEAA